MNEAGGTLVIPPFKESKKGFQFTKRENQKSYRIARHRIHVERCIERLKVFTVLDYIHADMREYMDDVATIVCALCNLKTDLIRRKP